MIVEQDEVTFVELNSSTNWGSGVCASNVEFSQVDANLEITATMAA